MWELSGWEFSRGRMFLESKKRYYENLNEKFIVDNKLFWKTVKPLLSDNELVKTDVRLLS